MGRFPVYRIENFETSNQAIYVSDFSEHLNKHPFIHHPHKHDFYACMIFLRGKGQHEIDFKNHAIEPGSIFFLRPGQMHKWSFKAMPEGFIFFHSQHFYDLAFQNHKIQDYPFYNSIYATPVLRITQEKAKAIVKYFEMLLSEYDAFLPLRNNKLAALIDLIYIDLSRLYPSNAITSTVNQGYLPKLRELESLIDLHYQVKKAPADYADMLHISGKHLNRIVKETLNKTVSEVIADRIVLEAKRLLALKKYSVAQVADMLGFHDNSYFNRFFKKHTNLTPLEFSLKV